MQENDGKRFVSLSPVYKVKHFHDELLELVWSRGNNGKLPLLQLPEQYFKYYGLIFPHTNNPSRLRKLLSSLKGDLKVTQVTFLLVRVQYYTDVMLKFHQPSNVQILEVCDYFYLFLRYLLL